LSKDTDHKPRPVLPVEKTVAVALDYDPHTADEAPRVVAKGKGYVAQRILEIAFDKGIKVREDADLAQMLTAVDVDSEIPIEAYLAVAEILAYVYKANNQLPPTVEEGA
jgi:flagellar biosynthesis protein